MSSPWHWGMDLGAVAIYGVVAGLNAYTSRMNAFFFFSKTVPEEFRSTDEARTIERRYRQELLWAFAVAVGLYLLLKMASPFSWLLCLCAGIMAQTLAASVAFARANGQVGQALRRMTNDSESLVTQPVSIPLLEQRSTAKHSVLWILLAPVAGLLGVYVAFASSRLGWGEFLQVMSQSRADGMLGLGVGMEFGAILLFLQLKYFSRSRSEMGRFTLEGARWMVWLGALAAILSATTVPLHWMVTSQIRIGVLCALLAVIATRMLYAYARSSRFAPPAAERGGDAFWRWGMFYYNPTDPSVFIQHRCGPGYTLNFARAVSWVLALALLADLGFVLSRHLWR